LREEVFSTNLSHPSRLARRSSHGEGSPDLRFRFTLDGLINGKSFFAKPKAQFLELLARHLHKGNRYIERVRT
jgi:hypothetical protein